jgi:hypothetical protein
MTVLIPVRPCTLIVAFRLRVLEEHWESGDFRTVKLRMRGHRKDCFEARNGRGKPVNRFVHGFGDETSR